MIYVDTLSSNIAITVEGAGVSTRVRLLDDSAPKASVWLAPDDARRLAADLIADADRADRLTADNATTKYLNATEPR